MSRLGNTAGSTLPAAGLARSGTAASLMSILITTGGMTITGPSRAGTG